MPDKLKIYNQTFTNEGFCACNEPGDPGGATSAYGISSVYWAADYAAIMALAPGQPQRDYAIAFYDRSFWGPNNMDLIEDTQTAYDIFDHAYNEGMDHDIVRFIQTGLNLVFGTRLNVDGVIGPHTAVAINARSAVAHAYAVRFRIGFYEMDFLNRVPKPSQDDLKSWMNRSAVIL